MGFSSLSRPRRTIRTPSPLLCTEHNRLTLQQGSPKFGPQLALISWQLAA
jgi:hypothetical protein